MITVWKKAQGAQQQTAASGGGKKATSQQQLWTVKVQTAGGCFKHAAKKIKAAMLAALSASTRWLSTQIEKGHIAEVSAAGTEGEGVEVWAGLDLAAAAGQVVGQ
jgi:hypothetical protein